MHLREVILRNWRSYRSAHFKFPEPKGKKRVILIGAMNGNGKTSLLISLYLGLFGREAMQHVEGVKLSNNDEDQARSYRQLLKQILHRPALDDPDPSAYVQLHFASDEHDVTVSRTWYYRRGGDLRDPDTQDGEEVRVEADGKVFPTRNWREANNAISDLLFPPHIAPCFFFDGEQAQKRVESSGGRALSDAVKTLFGTGILNELSRTLQGYIGNKNNQLRPEAKGFRDDELAVRRRRLDELATELSGVRDHLDVVRRQHDDAENARHAKLTELNQVVGDSAIDLTRLAQSRDDLRKREGEINRDFTDSLTKIAMPIALSKLGQRVRERLGKEMIRDKWTIVRDDATAKAEKIIAKALPENSADIDPPLIESQVEQLSKRFQSALQMLWSPPPDDCANEYRFVFLNSADRSNVASKMKSVGKMSGDEVARLATEWSAIRTRLAESNRKWDIVSDVRPRVEQVKLDLNTLDATAKELSSERIRLETKERSIQTEAGELRGAIGQMEAKQRDLDPVSGKLDIAYRVREVIESTQDRLIPLCRGAIQAACTKHFREMISGEYSTYKVQFDEEYQPILIGERGNPIYVTTLSGAQKRAFGLAFTLAVAEVTGQEAPLVIDTPVGNMDSEYRGRILTYLAKAANGQVIFLSHDEEISREYADQLKPYVLSEFLVKFDRVGEGVGVSTIEPDRYFSFN